MQLADFYTLAGFVATVFTLVIGAIQRDRSLMRQLADDKEKMNGNIANIRENFVSKSELNGHINKLESMLQNHITKTDVTLERINARLDKLIELRIHERA